MANQKAIENFSIDNIRTGETYSTLEDVFVPLYFFHRYQAEAAVKLVGGLDYSYAVKGAGQKVVETLAKKDQEKALNSVLKTLQAKTLAIPEEKLGHFPPRAFGFGRSRESFSSNTGVAFDALGAPATASDMTLSLLLNPQRAARLVQQKALNKKQLGLDEMLEKLISETIKSSERNNYLQEVQNTINHNVLQHLMNLAVHKKATPQVKAIVSHHIFGLEEWLKENNTNNPFMYSQFLRDIERFRTHPDEFRAMPHAPTIPDGSPIGSLKCEAPFYSRI